MNARPLQTGESSKRIRVANIGCGRRGLLKELIQSKDSTNIEIAAVCDTWRQKREKAAADVKEFTGKEPMQTAHYAEVLARKDIDAVVIGTPDHLHCTMLVDAIKAGKDVYVEKPLAMTMRDLIRAYDAVKRSDRVVQVGTQMRSYANSGGARKLIAAGELGKILKVEQVRNGYSPYWMSFGGARFLAEKPAEADVDWKAFLGDRKPRPFDDHPISGLVRLPRVLTRAAYQPDGALHRPGPLHHRREHPEACGGPGWDIPLEKRVRSP